MEKKRIGSLDALKAIAAVFIVFHHYQQDTGSGGTFPGVNFYGGKLVFGYVVELFFIISGFLTVYTENSENHTASDYFDRFIKKIERLWPMAAFATLFGTLILYSYRVIFKEWIDASHGIWSFFSSLFLFCFPVRDTMAINNPEWYIAVLLQCSLIYYLLCWICKKCLNISPVLSFIFMVLTGMALFSKNYNYIFIDQNYARGYTAFFIGAILPHVLKLIPKKLANSISILSILLITALFSLHFGEACDSQWEILTFVFFPSVVILFVQGRFIPGLLNNKFFNLLGKASFEVYLLHSPLIYAQALLFRLMNVHPVYSYLTMFIFTFVAEVIGIITCLFIEKPVNSFVRSKHSSIMASLS